MSLGRRLRAFVGDGAVDVMFCRGASDEGTEADALDDAGEGGVECRHVGGFLSFVVAEMGVCS